MNDAKTAPPLPNGFSAWAERLFGAETPAFLDALGQKPTLSVSANAAKWEKAGIATPENARKVEWASHGYYLASRPRFTFDPLLHAGAYYVEEASSMFVAQALQRVAGDIRIERALDLCAAPGGKTLLLRDTMQGGLLVANEPIAKRNAALAENVAKWGDPHVVVTCSYPESFSCLDGFFDLVMADVPCSGEGMFRKDHDARGEWSEKNVALCAKRQREIIGAVWNSLRTGGYLVYSTCTFNRYENEDNVAWIAESLGAEAIPIPVKTHWGICGDSTGRGMPVCHFYPGKAEGEGFFLALLKKTSPTEKAAGGKRNRNNCKFLSPAGYGEWIKNADNHLFADIAGTISAIPRELAEGYALLSEKAGVTAGGIAVCATKGGLPQNRKGAAAQPQPAAGLALSREFNGEAFPEIPLGYHEAVKYLRGETITPPDTTPRGIAAVTYRGLPLGFAKNVGTRLNNLYPDGWRIRSSHVPAEPPQLEFLT